ncbi:fluoride efflux transporter FluC [Austwickia chelonae]|uniref:fluoride efflux transporter FluC n=1 Tax=Austwickia chelonae TaxID=100225 RepID=UPI000E28A5E9|nr:CrcB family protein [Austwickia chelonae]
MLATPSPVAYRQWPLLLCVGAGGALGTAARASIAQTFPMSPAGFPWATLGVNLCGALALGWLIGFLSDFPDVGIRRVLRLTFGTGFLGGFTTYSTFVVESLLLGADARWLTALLYVAVTLSGGLVAAGVGFSVLPRGRAVGADHGGHES